MKSLLFAVLLFSSSAALAQDKPTSPPEKLCVLSIAALHLKPGSGRVKLGEDDIDLSELPPGSVGPGTDYLTIRVEGGSATQVAPITDKTAIGLLAGKPYRCSSNSN